jgi:hypothetical protein|tara:strand:- start:257 stop:451 length:195 start_codon:yes stop_codon:yes gene_type:complete
MDLIILHDGLYHLIPVNVELIAGHIWKDCFDLCDIVRDKITVYQANINKHVLQNGSFFFGCVCN